jgi:hypothetical protein
LIPVKGVEPLEVRENEAGVRTSDFSDNTDRCNARGQSGDDRVTFAIPLLVLFDDFLEGRKVILGELYGWPLIGHITLKNEEKVLVG